MRRAVSSARKALMTGFVPQHLGFGHIFRDEVTASQHTRTLTQDMFSSGSTGKKTPGHSQDLHLHTKVKQL